MSSIFLVTNFEYKYVLNIVWKETDFNYRNQDIIKTNAKRNNDENKFTYINEKKKKENFTPFIKLSANDRKR